MNVVVLSKADFGDALSRCTVGTPESLTLTIVPTSVSEDVVVANVTEAEYEGSDKEEPGEVKDTEDNTAYRPRPRKGSATAVEY